MNYLSVNHQWTENDIWFHCNFRFNFHVRRRCHCSEVKGEGSFHYSLVSKKYVEFSTQRDVRKKNKDRNVLSAALHTSRVLTQRVTWLSDLFRLQLKIPHNFLKTPFSYHSMHHAQIIKSVVYRLPTCLLSFDCMNGFPYSPLGQKMMLTFMYIYLA